MVKSCCVYQCTNRWGRGNNGEKLGFFRIPNANRYAVKRQEWISQLCRIDPKTKNTWIPHSEDVVCGAHFLTGAPHSDPRHPDFRPQVFSYKDTDLEKLKVDLDRYTRSTKRTKEKVEKVRRDDAVAGLLDLSISTQPDHTDVESLQQDLPSYDELSKKAEFLSAENQNLMKELSEARVQNQQVSDELNAVKKDLENVNTKYSSETFGESMIRGNDTKTTFYTGLHCFLLFEMIFNVVSPGVVGTKTKLSLKDEFFVTLVKLRLNLSFEDMAYRLGISTSTVSRIFCKWLDVLHEKLKFLIKWPSREAVSGTLPNMFRKYFPRAVAIIDCTEIFIEKPSRLKTRAQTFSNYKNHNTVKLLIGVTPSGSFSFLSHAWGGKASDKEIVQNSKFLDKLVQGDQVLADRGFINNEDFNVRGASLVIPAFTKGRKQLPAKDVEKSKTLAHVRIEVERLIGLLKSKFQILKGPIPISLIKREDDTMYATVDKMVTVCAALTNLMQTIVNSDKL